MYLGIFDIDEYVPIPAATHRFSSGAAYAPSALTYSIYEEGSTTGLDEDVDMTPASPFDAATGAYYVRRQLTAAAGFERGKTYMVLIKATVDSVSAAEWHTFQMRAVQSGDSFSRIGANGAGLTEVAIATGGIATTSFAAGAIDAAAAAADFGTEMGTAVWASAARTLTSAASFQIKKNTELAAFPFVMTDSTNHAPATGATVTATRSIGEAAFGACANAVTEISGGWYRITLAAADLNGATIALKFTADGCDDLNITLVTQS